MGVIVDIDMEAALTGGAEWTGTVVGSGQALVRATDSGLFGSVAGAKLTIGGTANVYAYKTFTAIGTTVATARFALADLVALSQSATPTHRIFNIRNTALGQRGYLQYSWAAGVHSLQLFHLDDPGTPFSTSLYAIDANTTYLQFKWEKSSGNGVTDGAFSLYFNDTLKERKTGLEIWDQFNFDEIRIGGFDTVDAVTTGSWKFDKIVVRDDATLPGSPNVDPVVDAGADQTGILGTPKVVTTVSFTDTDAVECDLTCDAGGTITVVPNGSANVTGNGTNAVNITGTNAEILATIDSTNGITLGRAQVAWTDESSPPPAGHIDYEDTILVEVTDSGALSHSDGFVMRWTLPTGNNEKSILLDHATLSGINDEIDLASLIPVADTEYVDAAYIIATDDNGNSSWVLVPLTVSSPKSGGHSVLSGVGSGVLQGAM